MHQQKNSNINFIRELTQELTSPLFPSTLFSKSSENYVYDPLWRSKIRKPISQDIEEKGIINNISIVSGSSNKELSEEVANRLNLPLSNVVITKDDEKEIGISLRDNPEGKDLFIITSLSPPVNDNLAELLFLIAEAKRAGANTVHLIVPYLGYSIVAQSLRHTNPIYSADIARMLEIAGADSISTIELHHGQIEGFYNIPIDNMSSLVIFSEYLYNSNLVKSFDQTLVVSPDANGVKRAKDFCDILAKKVGIPVNMAFTATSFKLNEEKIMNEKKIKEHYVSQKDSKETVVVGNVEGLDCILIDDMVKSGTTLIESATALKKNGAKKVYAFVTHCLADEITSKDIDKSCIDKIIVTNSISFNQTSKKMSVLSVGPLVAEIIRRIYLKESLSEITYH
eukprot:CAMPEP_0170527038 /NCGR_PEP_ID=MMETSP0209-20121228/12469_1 /TAXON_ID=665100 ORGANISM="Litonotus pictus, Strain P1" /NCGR_SAMPLE_ID=MMETSP0209 /ASSEMBLY_ACC=CAM_ASM_000301 /LENGTH=396 /DNA_ID=CAMNT_0010817261 /DNA_START=71 /DNA_END=1261 /DNA_ORIENTATION=-